MKVIDLFCGAGGFSEGFERAGFEIVRAYDIWAPAILTHNQNHGNGKQIAFKGDIYEISMLDNDEFEKWIPDTEVIIGSPPCIAFSNSNKSGKADKTEGIKLIEAFLRIVARKMSKPNSKLKYWVMENVENSLGFVEDKYTAEELSWPELGDFILNVPQKRIFNMKYFGVPTNRKRSICGLYPDLQELNGENDIITLGEVQKALGKPAPLSYSNSSEMVKDPIYGIEMLSKELTDHHYVKEVPYFEWIKAKRQKRDKGYMGKMAFPENKDKPARTIMATLSGSSRESMIFDLEGSEKRYRFPTIREVATLMSFPIDFRFYGDSDSVKYRMIGNAVTPKFSYEIAKAIRENLNYQMSNDRFSVRKYFNKDILFTNLNGTVFDLKKEKPKKFESKYSYHVPYIIEKSYRVGLENQFSNGTVHWKTKIHYSQGKNAKVYENIFVNLCLYEPEEMLKITKFAKEYIRETYSFNNIQIQYCKTVEDRDGIGPDELLQAIKGFVESNNQFDRVVFIKEIGKEISMKIVTSYYLLENILKGIEDGN
ncbi:MULTISPECIES: DNA cytosine methyltransferase [Bacillus]|uniref:DNA cytosine methyltransferase n=1 Tax=Bacillus TaxID=1386 RepID=UPI00027950C7|nr:MULTISPECIES: DNA cytosine methyltransferase [Bacillus]EJQ85318.1 DNA (cytosine-5-)-methyltransferase [Bacillus toyonensis]MDA1877395.1 DNA cytosine methyltransferase [Bacillus cereus group sp. BY112LC]QEQ16007.1 DNA cytosine methyltransferase [Bacillus sp. BS98]QWG96425.1 DNA cytosine methyltransferase [Bacillus toyonensis]WIG37764.1 DNA cytosine methyltransferase [Bacillus toyonensis]